MAKTWVLDTETKGTGAHMAPLESADRDARESGELSTVTLRRAPARKPAAPTRPRTQRFKVVDVLSGQVLAEDVGAREAVSALERLHSVLDARVSLWSPTGRWKLLSLDEQKALWRFRRRPAGTAAGER